MPCDPYLHLNNLRVTPEQIGTLSLPPVRTKRFGGCAFFSAAATLWTALSVVLRKESEIGSIRKSLKHVLFYSAKILRL